MTHHTFEGFIHVFTGRAMLFQSHYWDGPVWFPTSQTEIEPDGDMFVVIRVKDWLPRKRGILEFTHYGEHDIERIAAT